MNNKEAVFLVAGLLIGGSTGYLVARKQLEIKFEKRAEEDIQSVKDTYAARYADTEEQVEGWTQEDIDRNRVATHTGSAFVKPKTPPTDEELEAAVRIHDQRQLFPVKPGYVREVIEGRNQGGVSIVEDPDKRGDDPTKWERDVTAPYVISIEEFQEGFESHGNATLHYFEYDNTLADEVEYKKGRESGIIPENAVDEIIGSANLLHFGKGAQDEDWLYVRNEQLHMDYEIERFTESYSETVLGIVPDEEWERQPKNPKMRGDD